jgi:uncharacterized protein YjbI with pentapeptide repeats
MIQIKNRFYNSVIFEGNFDTILQAVLAALKNKKDLRKADLRGAYLIGADLREADLREADLRKANLREVDLSGADLIGADLREADLRKANLREVDLSGADLIGADLRWADLSGADLIGADLDFSVLHFSCKTLSTKFDQKHIIQILYHAAMPCQKNSLKLDKDVKALLSSKMFKKVVNKFHRVEECGQFTSVKES